MLRGGEEEEVAGSGFEGMEALTRAIEAGDSDRVFTMREFEDDCFLQCYCEYRSLLLTPPSVSATHLLMTTHRRASCLSKWTGTIV